MLPRRSEAGRDRLLQAYIACDGTVSLPQDSDGTMSARCTQKPTRHRANHFTIVEATSVNRTRYRYLRAYLEQGVYPHINLYRGRYTNAVLARSTHLIGQPRLVYMNVDNLRYMRAVLVPTARISVYLSRKGRGASCRTISS
jgi:hypothetical protein